MFEPRCPSYSPACSPYAELIAHCDVRWADSALCTGGPRLRFRACSAGAAVPPCAAPAVAAYLGRANCGLAYGAWEWDPCAAPRESGGSSSAPVPAFCCDVRFATEEAGCACVARCAAAIKAGLETW